VSANNPYLVSVIGSDTLCVIQKLLFILSVDVDRYQRSIIGIDCPNTIDIKDRLHGIGEVIFGVS
jgi:hypothetical protein